MWSIQDVFQNKSPRVIDLALEVIAILEETSGLLGFAIDIVKNEKSPTMYLFGGDSKIVIGRGEKCETVEVNNLPFELHKCQIKQDEETKKRWVVLVSKKSDFPIIAALEDF